jgi:predicted nucleotidyltransferase component of viral defense system
MNLKKELIDIIQSEKKIANRQLIEKDLILHKVLLKLSKNKDFRKNYAFKGGTCLTKAYLGYFRFSEDLDFTFINQKEFKNLSKKNIRKKINLKLNKIISFLEQISKEEGLIFSKDKTDLKYFQFGAGNIFTTLKIYYISLETNKEEFFKIQINFLEKLFFNLTEKKLFSLITIKDEMILPKSYNWIFEKPILFCYDIKEILCEKVRAILTRQGLKSRDFINVFMIEKKEGLPIYDFESEIIEKINYSLINIKYKENLKNKNKNFPYYKRGEEEKILLIDLGLEFYEVFLKKFNEFLIQLIERLN